MYELRYAEILDNVFIQYKLMSLLVLLTYLLTTTILSYKLHQFIVSSAVKYLCSFSCSRQLTMGDRESNSEAPENGIRIFEVVARGDHEALSDLLLTDTTSVCAIDEEGNTALHHAVRSACQEDNNDENFYQCIDLLMKCKETKINMPNKNGYTAIGLAVHYDHKKCVEFMLKHPSADRLHLHSSVSTPLLEAILEDCLECNDEPEKSDYFKLTFNCEILNKIIPYMMECPNQRELLKHPVTSCFISVHYEYIICHIFASIVIYSIQLLTPMYAYAYLYPDDVPVILLSFLWIVGVICDLSFYSRLNHIKILRTFEFFLFLPMIIYIVGLAFDVLKNSWIWFYVLVISSLLASLKLVLMIGRLPLVALLIEMLKRVRRTNMAVYTFLLTIIGFIIYINYKDKNVFSPESVQALLKIIYTYMFQNGSININFDIFPCTIQAIFHFFVVLASIIFLTLMIRLDWLELRNEAETLSVVKIVRILIDSNIYRISPKGFWSNEMNEGKLGVYPQRCQTPYPRLFYVFTNRPCFSHCIRIKKKQPSENPI